MRIVFVDNSFECCYRKLIVAMLSSVLSTDGYDLSAGEDEEG